jgi:predicted amidohydrolase
MLRGADVILWPTRAKLPTKDFSLTQLVRARASESRIYILAATPLTRRNIPGESSVYGESLIADPNGTVIAPALPDVAMAASAQLQVAFSRHKLSAPGTDTVYNRRPELYRLLVEEAE